MLFSLLKNVFQNPKTITDEKIFNEVKACCNDFTTVSYGVYSGNPHRNFETPVHCLWLLKNIVPLL